MLNCLKLLDKFARHLLICTISKNAEKLLKSKFIDLSDKNYSYDALPIYSENAPTVLRSQTALDTLPGEIYSIEANNKITNNCAYSFSAIEAVKNQIKKTNTVGLAKLLKLNVGAKVKLPVNIDIQDYLCEETMLKISVKRYMLRLQSTLSPSIKRGQSPLALAWESTVDKVQGLSLDQGIADFDLKKQNLFRPRKTYSALKRLLNCFAQASIKALQSK